MPTRTSHQFRAFSNRTGYGQRSPSLPSTLSKPRAGNDSPAMRASHPSLLSEGLAAPTIATMPARTTSAKLILKLIKLLLIYAFVPEVGFELDSFCYIYPLLSNLLHPSF